MSGAYQVEDVEEVLFSEGLQRALVLHERQRVGDREVDQREVLEQGEEAERENFQVQQRGLHEPHARHGLSLEGRLLDHLLDQLFPLLFFLHLINSRERQTKEPRILALIAARSRWYRARNTGYGLIAAAPAAR